uniref:Uncharacterized protein n=1 Tax=Tanacetum cinerariifolium TaxID=118510 RepID=A0A6L2NQB8_TANCI|nr:hypothetical protein [Tanacetum cinerariifolium]
MAKLVLNEARTEKYLVEPSIESIKKYELSEELLKELCSNSYNERDKEYVVGHIAKVLEVLDSIKVADEDVSRNDRDHINSSMLTKPKLKIGDEFLKILHDNSFNGMNGSDIAEHIGKVLETTEWVKILNVDKDELRLHALSKSLSEDAKKW